MEIGQTPTITYLNTTIVKVKLYNRIRIELGDNNLNTTIVKVKLSIIFSRFYKFLI